MSKSRNRVIRGRFKGKRTGDNKSVDAERANSAISEEGKRFLELRKKRKQAVSVAKSAVVELKKHTALLEWIGEKKLFFDILQDLMVSVEPMRIVKNFREHGFDVDTVSVACVAHHATVFLQKIRHNASAEEFERAKNFFNKTVFWNNYWDYRTVLKKHAMSSDNDVNSIMHNRLKELGKRIA